MSVFRSDGRTNGWMVQVALKVHLAVCGVRKKGYDIVVAKDVKFN